MRYFHMILIVISMISCGKEVQFVPENYAGMQRVKYLTGSEAKNFVDKLHHKSVTPENNEIGFYEGKNGPATIYVTYYNSGLLAEEEFQKMVQKISPDNSVFVGGTNLEIKGKSIYRCYGMGQTHFVFAQNNVLIWLSVNTLKAKYLLEKYLEVIRGY